jgi:serine/threonine protein kinase
MGMARLNPGAILNGRCQLITVVGQGGFGAVYKAADLQFGNRLLAIKEMLQDGLSPQEIADATKNFKQETLPLASLKHPSLPSIYDHFTEAGRWYLAMDFIEGETLEARIDRAPGKTLATDEALRITEQLCSVLSYLHDRPQPIIFRDLKPLNIMLTPANHLYLIDFGIARLFKPGQTRDTEAFASMGYAAPEQFGKAQTNARSDIYSLGATLHQMLTGIDPAIQPFQFRPIRSVNPGVSLDLERLVLQMVDLDPVKRPANVSSVQRALHTIALGTNASQSNAPTQKAPTQLVASTPKTRSSGSATIGIILGSLLVLSLCSIGASQVSGLFTQGTAGVSGTATTANTFGALVPVGQVVYRTAAPGQCDTQGGNWTQNSYAVQSCEANGLSLAGSDCPCPLGVVALAALPTQAIPRNYGRKLALSS